MNVDQFGPLPISWDGDPVEWGSWEPTVPIWMCDRSRRKPAQELCGGCHRSAAGQPIAWGKIRGRRALAAFRCMGCGHDVVHELRTDDVWDLGPEDYGLAGSVAPRV